ncbi:MAG: acyl-CoA dehydrogenase family protein [Clostridia bacterium]|nr:acyl-CoA dehydrogenase family protein [Clostridia bacterium]MCL6522235.1 acyl-CoA dehydrogenase family protein [Bacillota bacterium]
MGRVDFELDEVARELRQAARELAQRRLAPRAAALDEEERFPWENVEALGEAGFLGMMVAPEYGGAGASTLEHALVVEEVARADASAAVLLEVHNALACGILERFGDAQLKQAWLPRMVGRGLLGAYALTEPQAGSDAAAIRTRALRRGDRYRLEGMKTFITGAGFADLYVVFAVTDPEAGKHGISAFLVPRESPGLAFGKPMKKMGIRAALTAELYLDGVEVPAEWRIGREGEGYKMALACLDAGRVGIAAQALGIAEAALEAARAYALEREQFGQPIAAFQGIQWKLAELATEVEAARLLTYRAAWLADRPGRHSAAIAQAKLFASRVAVAAALEAIQIHGGSGYVRETGVERLLRDAKITEIYEGTSEIQRLVIARELLSRSRVRAEAAASAQPEGADQRQAHPEEPGAAQASQKRA